MGDNKTEELRAIIKAHEAQRGSTGRSVEMKVVCPSCMTENPASRLTCWHCGEDIVDAKEFQTRVAPPVVSHATQDAPSVAFPTENPTTDDQILTQATFYSAGDHTKPEKPASLLQVAFSVGISLLLILAGSIFFQVMHSFPRILFIVGFIIGFGLTLLKTSSDWKDSHEGGNSSHSLFPDWLTLPIVLAFGIIVLVVAFGWEFILDWLFSQDVEERVYALLLGLAFGVGIEISLNYTLQSFKQYRLN